MCIVMLVNCWDSGISCMTRLLRAYLGRKVKVGQAAMEGFGWIACRVSGPPSTNPFLVLTTSTDRGKLSRV